MVELSFRARRLVSLSITAVAILLVASIARIGGNASSATTNFTGWTLFGIVTLLMLIGLRRRIPVLPLGRMSNWMQVHLYVGIFSLGVYVLHVPAILGRGRFTCILSLLFLFVAFSGIYGIYVSRTLPKRLTGNKAAPLRLRLWIAVHSILSLALFLGGWVHATTL